MDTIISGTRALCDYDPFNKWFCQLISPFITYYAIYKVFLDLEDNPFQPADRHWNLKINSEYYYMPV